MAVYMKLNKTLHQLARLAPLRCTGFRLCTCVARGPGLLARRIQAQPPMRHHLRAKDGRDGK
jgi:hypothetical protein